MASTSTKKKSPWLTIVIVILIIVFLANFENFEDNSQGSSDPHDERPGISQDSGSTVTTEQITIPEDQKNTLFAAVPEHLRSNYFLTYKEQGCCKTLSGAVHVTVVMISDSVSSWDNGAVSKLEASLNASALDIVSEAKNYGTQVSLSFSYHHASLSGDICSGDYSNDWQEPALTSAGLPGLSQIHDHVTATYQVKEAPVVFAFNKDSRAYASVGGNEFLVLFTDDDFGAFQHELTHVFGAHDYYYPVEIKSLANTYLPDSIMNSGETADPLTAYLIGWTATLADTAISFLENTNTITSAYMAEQGKLESFTGYGTKVTDYGTYTGDMVRGVFHGTGTLTYNNGGWYTGSWNNGAWSGKGSGKTVFDDGGVYEGDYLNGNRHGTGTYTYPDGAVYTGGWSENDQDGTGTIRYPNGSWYTGGWNDGNWSGNGNGEWFYDDGGVYEGAFLNGQLHGTGTYTYANGNWYSGGWNNGNWAGSGKGKWKYDDGSVYEGGFLNGQFHGTGTYTYANGGWYSGGWTNGQRSGNARGKEIYNNGIYEGDLLNGSRHGQGTYTWTNGDSYTGQWVNGERTGYGTYTWSDGSKQSGTWQDGKFIG